MSRTTDSSIDSDLKELAESSAKLERWVLTLANLSASESVAVSSAASSICSMTGKNALWL